MRISVVAEERDRLKQSVYLRLSVSSFLFLFTHTHTHTHTNSGPQEFHHSLISLPQLLPANSRLKNSFHSVMSNTQNKLEIYTANL